MDEDDLFKSVVKLHYSHDETRTILHKVHGKYRYILAHRLFLTHMGVLSGFWEGS